VRDRIAQTVVARRLEGKVEPIFHPDCYRYRPGRSALDAIAVCRQRCWRYGWVIDLDVQKVFDSVRWDLVVKAVQAHTDADARWVVLLGQAVACRTYTAAGRDRAAARPGDPTGLGGLARAGEPVSALRLRCVDGRQVSNRPVCKVCRRWCAKNAEGGSGVEDGSSDAVLHW
jgi:hypothetical protein